MAKFTSVTCKGYYDYVVVSYKSDITIDKIPYISIDDNGDNKFDGSVPSNQTKWTKKSNTTGDIEIYGYTPYGSTTSSKFSNKTYNFQLQYATSTAAFSLSVNGKIANTKYSVTNTPTFNSSSTSLSVTTNNNISHLCNLVVTVAGYTVYSSNVTSQNISIPISSSIINALYPKIINSSTSAITATLKTVGHYSSPSISKTGTYTIIQDSGNSPTKPSFTYLNNHSASVTLLGTNQKFIKGFGSCVINIPAASKAKAQKSATISKYDLVFENFKTISGVVTDTAKMNDTTNALTITQSLEHLGDCKVKLKVTDSRGFSTTSDAVSIFVYEYERPSLSPQLSRLNNFENQMILSLRGLIYNKTSIKNTVTALKYRYSPTGTSLPGTYTNISGFTYESVSQSNKNPYNASEYTTTLDYINYSNNNFIQLANDKTYNIEFVFQDALGDVSVPIVVDKGIPIMGMWEHPSLGGQVGINCVPDVAGKALQIKGGADISGDLLVNQVNILASLQQLNSSLHPIGSLYLTTDSNNPNKIFGGTWELFSPGRTLVCVDTSQSEFNSVSKKGGHKSLQSHTHSFSSTSNSSGSHTHAMYGAYDGYSYTAHTANAAPNQEWCSFTKSYSDSTQLKSGGAHTHSVSGTTGTTGGGNAQNLQPYITCYIWKRTA